MYKNLERNRMSEAMISDVHLHISMPSIQINGMTPVTVMMVVMDGNEC